MLKTAGALLVILACFGLGYQKGLLLAKRKRQLEEIQKMLLLLLGEITYQREALPEAMEQVADKLRGPLAEFLRETSRQAKGYEGERFSSIFSQKTEEYLRETGMTKRDREEFARLGEYLGSLDISVQKNTAALYLEELKRELSRLSKELPEKRKLYQSMGVMGGIFLAILLA